jgi:hypothetical protein
MEEWKAASDEVSTNNRSMLDQYDRIWKNKKLDIDQKMEEYKLVASQHQDEISWNLANQRNYTMLAQQNEKIREFQTKNEQTAQKIWMETEKMVLQKRDIESKIAARQDPNMRSGPAMAAQEFRKEWKETHGGQEPPASEMSKFIAKQRAQASATTYWEGNGKGATQLQATNTALVHLDTIEQLAAALNNGDSRAANYLYQSIGRQFGAPAPVSFDAAMQLVGPELVNAITAGGGGVEERRNATGMLSRISSPDQISQPIATLKQMLAGRLGTAKRRYMQDTGEDEESFNSRLEPEAQQLLSGGGGGGGKPQQVIQNGHTYDLQPDGTYK